MRRLRFAASGEAAVICAECARGRFHLATALALRR